MIKKTAKSIIVRAGHTSLTETPIPLLKLISLGVIFIAYSLQSLRKLLFVKAFGGAKLIKRGICIPEPHVDHAHQNSRVIHINIHKQYIIMINNSYILLTPPRG